MPSSTDWVATYHRRSWPDSGSRPDRAPTIRRRCSQNYQMNSMNWGNFGDRARRPLQNQSCPFKRGPPERWPSGLRRTLGKRVCGKPYRGFESHSLRQQVIDITEIIQAPANCATFPKVSGRIRESSKLRARITAIFFNQLGQFSEGHFASAVLVAMMVRFGPHVPPVCSGFKSFSDEREYP